jgi:hypothetical protein
MSEQGLTLELDKARGSNTCSSHDDDDDGVIEKEWGWLGGCGVSATNFFWKS